MRSVHGLLKQGWKRVFLDLDSEEGLAPGQNWRKELHRAVHECEAVLLLISPEWADSRWCIVVFMLATTIGQADSSRFSWCRPLVLCCRPNCSTSSSILICLTSKARKWHWSGWRSVFEGRRRTWRLSLTHEDPGRLPYRGWKLTKPGMRDLFRRQNTIAPGMS